MTEPELSGNITVSYEVKKFENNKINILVLVSADGSGISSVLKPDGNTIVGNNKTTVGIDYIIENNQEYMFKITLSTGRTIEKIIKYEDLEAPTAEIKLAKTFIFNGGKIEANIKLKDNKSGINITNCKWVATTDSTEIGLDENLYTGGEFTSETQKIETSEITDPGTYYIHLLLEDNVGNVAEVISKKVDIKDGLEISTPEEFQAMETNLAGHYYVTKDIDMSEFNFTPIN